MTRKMIVEKIENLIKQNEEHDPEGNKCLIQYDEAAHDIADWFIKRFNILVEPPPAKDPEGKK